MEVAYSILSSSLNHPSLLKWRPPPFTPKAKDVPGIKIRKRGARKGFQE
jgi:hypothetical protein